MIAYLRGRLRENDADSAVVEVGGIGYQVLVSGATLGALPPTGQEVELHIHSHFVKDEPIRLYGFTDADERRLFQTLIGVQGVGPRVALAILAGVAHDELVRAISSSDVARLTQVKGVGRKIAERLALELRDKITSLPASARALPGGAAAAPPRGVPRGPLGDVHGALTQLGYKPGEIDPVLERLDAARPVPELVREALGALGRR